jgi:chorismate dehydratase
LKPVRAGLQPLRAGRIIYTNDIPIYAAFDQGAVTFPGSLLEAVPAALNAMLLDGRLDVSPISAFAYLANADRLALLGRLCIGSRRDVWSVVLVSAEAPAALGGVPIAVTKESASGRNLLRVLLERRYGVRALFVEVDDPLAVALAGKPAFLIGDRAIDAQLAFAPGMVYDLGSLWHAWTGCDMVYAVWAARRDVVETNPAALQAALESLVTARAWGYANPEPVIAAAQAHVSRPAGFYAAYYATLNFELDERALLGLGRFADELAALGAIAQRPSVTPEVDLVAR